MFTLMLKAGKQSPLHSKLNEKVTFARRRVCATAKRYKWNDEIENYLLVSLNSSKASIEQQDLCKIKVFQ